MSAHEPPAAPAMANEFSVSTPSRPISSGHYRESVSSSRSRKTVTGFRAGIGLGGIARRSLGIFLLLMTVVLWTGSNFLASYIFADDSYSKPYFVTYINTSFFALSLPPIFFRIAHQDGYSNIKDAMLEYWHNGMSSYRRITSRSKSQAEDEALYPNLSSGTRLLVDEDGPDHQDSVDEPEGVLTVAETAKLSLEFCLLWFIANYFMGACLKYTSVASSTILTSTSSIWTLVFGALVRVERFSLRKLLGVLASLAGIILISSVDLSGDNDENRGDFPHKSQQDIAIGDAMAFFSAIMYGVYTVVMKKRIGNEDRVNMPLFFGLVGLFNVVFLWPGFFILHFTGVETFEFPPTGKIWAIVLINSLSSFISDFCWAYAMLLTTPLVVTVGLSLTIPLSLVGQIILSNQYSSTMYWIGAFVVFLSFLFINHESHEDGEQATRDDDEQARRIA